MIIEDEAAIGLDLKSRVERLGYTVSANLASSEAALDKAQEDPPDLVLMDIEFTAVSGGIEAAEVIRSRLEIPLVLVAAEADQQSLARAKLDMPCGYLRRPFQDQDIKMTIDMAMYAAKVDRQRKLAVQALWDSEQRLRITSQISEVFLTVADEQMYSEVLRLVLDALQSEYGTFGYFRQDGSFVTPAMTREVYWEKCDVPDKEIIFEKGTFSGIWKQAIAAKQTLVKNDGPFSTPQGHLPIVNTIVAPIYYRGELISVLHLANKPGGYSDQDVILLTAIADHISPVLHSRLQAEARQRARKQAEQQYQTIIHTALDGFWIVDLEGRFLDVNDAYSELIGYSRTELLEMGVADIEAVQTAEEISQHIRKIIEQGGDRFESRHRRKDGGFVDLDISARYLEGEPGRVYVFLRDITDRRRAEAELSKHRQRLEELVRERTAALRESEELYRAFFQENVAPVFWLEMRAPVPVDLPVEDQVDMLFHEAYIKDCSDLAAHLYGFNQREELIGSSLPVIWSPESTEPENATHQYFQEFVRAGYKLYGTEVPGKSQAGEDKWFLNNLKGVVENRRLVRIWGSQIDITTRKMAEEALQESQVFNETLLNTSPDTIYIYDIIEKHNVYSNEGIGRVLGYSVTEVQAMGENLLHILMHPQDMELYLTETLPRYQQVEDGEFIEHEYRMKHKDGSWRWLHGKESIFSRLSDGKPKQVFGVVRDFTERKWAQDKLRESRDLLEAVFEGTTAAIFMKDADGRYLMVNSVCTKAMGRSSADEIVGRDDAALLPADAAHVLREHDEAIMASGQAATFEEITYFDGVTKTWLSTKSPFYDDAGNVVGVIGSAQDITERVQAEEKLGRSQAHQAVVLRSLPMVFYTANPFANLFEPSWVSEQIEQISGFTAQTILESEDHVVSRLHPEDRDRALAEYGAIVESGSVQIEYRWQVSDGSYRWFQDTAVLARDEHDRPAEVIGTWIDITERKGTEERLKESEERFRGIMEQSPFAISILTPIGVISQVNPAWLQLWGVTRETQLKFCDKYNIFRDEQVRELGVMPLFERAFAGEPVILPPIEYDAGRTLEDLEITSEGGSKRWIQCHLYPVKGANGEILNVVLMYEDITKRKQAEEELRRSEEKFAKAFHSSPDSITLTAVETGRIVEANKGFERVTGYTREEALGKTTLELGIVRRPEDRERLTALLAENNVIRDQELSLNTKSGEVVTCVLSGGLIETQEQRYVLTIARDITERKRAEEEARQRQQQLVEADRLASLGTLVAGVAHEINNPTSFIVLNAPVLEEMWNEVLPVLDQHREQHGDFAIGAMTYDTVREYVPLLLRSIFEGGERIKKIVKDLKDFARQDTTGIHTRIDLNQVVDAAVALMENRIKKATNQISVETEPNLPEISGSFQRLEQVVVNLINNACEALPDRNHGLRIATAIGPDRDVVLLTVQDQGAGIPEYELSRILDPFFTTKRDSGGTGLGLSISDGIVREHGGTLTFDSVPGEGTEVTMALPINEPGG
jgi:PAS domain S-box-containing protein